MQELKHSLFKKSDLFNIKGYIRLEIQEIIRSSAWLQKSEKVRVNECTHHTSPITYPDDFNPENLLLKINKVCRFIIQGIII